MSGSSVSGCATFPSFRLSLVSCAWYVHACARQEPDANRLAALRASTQGAHAGYQPATSHFPSPLRVTCAPTSAWHARFCAAPRCFDTSGWMHSCSREARMATVGRYVVRRSSRTTCR